MYEMYVWSDRVPLIKSFTINNNTVIIIIIVLSLVSTCLLWARVMNSTLIHHMSRHTTLTSHLLVNSLPSPPSQVPNPPTYCRT
jgi:hypothetical protein